MQTSFREAFRQTMPVVLQTAAGAAMVLLSWLVISVLPMVERISVPLRFSVESLLVAILLTVLVILLLRLGVHLKRSFRSVPSVFPYSGQIALMVSWLASIAILYSAYLPLVKPYTGRFEWVYSVLFLLPFLTVMAVIGYCVFAGMRLVGEALQGQQGGERAATEKSPAVVEEAKPATVTPAASKKKAAEAEEAKKSFCEQCGAETREGAKFCASCGASLG